MRTFPALLVCLLSTFACGPTSSAADVTDLADATLAADVEIAPCCCAFVRQGDIDIISEDLRSPDECPTLDQGECVDPEIIADRITPHPCCPEATGARCGD